jgi:hypothetical protein
VEKVVVEGDFYFIPLSIDILALFFGDIDGIVLPD